MSESGKGGEMPPLRQPPQRTAEEDRERQSALPSNQFNEVAFGHPPQLQFGQQGHRSSPLPVMNPGMFDPQLMQQQMQMLMHQNHQLMMQQQGATGRPAQSNKNNKKGGQASWFNQEETDLLLDLIEEHLPMGQEGWLTVVDRFNKQVAPE
jgi:hypothetical protein